MRILVAELNVTGCLKTYLIREDFWNSCQFLYPDCAILADVYLIQESVYENFPENVTLKYTMSIYNYVKNQIQLQTQQREERNRRFVDESNDNRYESEEGNQESNQSIDNEYCDSDDDFIFAGSDESDDEDLNALDESLYMCANLEAN
eukprot:Awhi_evm1s15600